MSSLYSYPKSVRQVLLTILILKIKTLNLRMSNLAEFTQKVNSEQGFLSGSLTPKLVL